MGYGLASETDIDPFKRDAAAYMAKMKKVRDEMRGLESMTAEQLNDWYLSNVGYRPQEDDSSMTDAELRQLCCEVLREMLGAQ